MNSLEPQLQACVNNFEEVLIDKCKQGKGNATIDIVRMMGHLAGVFLSFYHLIS
jgi:hypothetical protein